MELTIYTDGASNLGAKKSGHGWVIYEGETKLHEKFENSEEGKTNNQEEYLAVVSALKFISKTYPELPQKIIIKSDSELMVKQLTGAYKIKNYGLKDLARRVKLLSRKLGNVSIVHIPRELNTEADVLAKKAMNSVLK